MLTQIRLFNNIIENDKVTGYYRDMRNAVLSFALAEYAELNYFLIKGGDEVDEYRESMEEHMNEIMEMCEPDNFSYYTIDNAISTKIYQEDLHREAERMLLHGCSRRFAEVVKAYDLQSADRLNEYQCYLGA